jgi:hypothetical protein
MESKDNFIIRNVSQDDLPFIFSTWLRSFRYSSTFANEISKEVYYEFHTKVIDRILSRIPTIYIACDKTSPDTIFGYILGEGEVLHFIYVKKDFRKLGIGSTLLDTYGIPKYISHLTKSAKKFIENNPTVRYNPYYV